MRTRWASRRSARSTWLTWCSSPAAAPRRARGRARRSAAADRQLGRADDGGSRRRCCPASPMPGPAVHLAAETVGSPGPTWPPASATRSPATSTTPAWPVLARRLLANQVIERWAPGRSSRTFVDAARHRPTDGGPTVDRRRRSTTTSSPRSNRERGLALDPAELHAIAAHYRAVGREPTDVELETLAQTWSEHCAHKTFRARITTDDGTRDRAPAAPAARRHRRDRRAVRAQRVRRQRRHRLVRRRHDAGREGRDAQPPVGHRAVRRRQHRRRRRDPRRDGRRAPPDRRHRHPLLRPGRPRRPTSCPRACCTRGSSQSGVDRRRRRLRQQDRPADRRRRRALRPRLHRQPARLRGCIGVAADRAGRCPARNAGDLVVVLGGRTGRDGLRGATFSSATMDATTGDVAGASVQIGDPITEKLLIDALARRAAACTPRSPTAAPAACRRRSARWPSASAPTSTCAAPR